MTTVYMGTATSETITVNSSSGSTSSNSGNYIEVVSTMPTASSSNAGKIVLYNGATNSSYTAGKFYQCTMTEDTPEQAEITLTNATGIGTVTCNAETFGDMVNEAPDSYDFLYRGYPETIKVEQHSEEKTLTRSRTNDTNGKYGWLDANNNVYLSNVEDVDEDATFDDVNRTSDFSVMYLETLTRSTAYGSWKWDLGDGFYESVDLADYGISYNGVAPVGAKITITYTPQEDIEQTYTWAQVSLT